MVGVRIATVIVVTSTCGACGSEDGAPEVDAGSAPRECWQGGVYDFGSEDLARRDCEGFHGTLCTEAIVAGTATDWSCRFDTGCFCPEPRRTDAGDG